MTNHSSRREFLKASMAAAAVAGLPSAVQPLGAVPAPAPKARITKGLVYGMLPKELSYDEQFKMAADAGFECVEAYTTPDEGNAEKIKKAAESAGIKIHSVMNQAHWDYPLSSDDPAVVAKSMEGMRTSLRNAKLWGADAVLLVPAVVNPKTSYRDAWTRSQKHIRELIPMAKDLGVIIALEEVWNKFLLSPLEFAAYVDEFKSPWVKAYFDVGNVVLYGYPQDWIRTLGKRIVKVHLKDFKLKRDGYEWVNLGDGDVDWPEVRKAFDEVGYSGTACVEIEGGDLAYLKDVSKRFDRLVLGM
ncbi:MAG TPA: sugar phosphate isomerase/epimerase family protein [Terriglobia bacterium]|nr:sugar phosphate isomerase/epimerase family protein [Terriglobia bacterium]